MCEEKTAVLIAAGTELTEGIIQDTHARYLASELTSLGFAVLRSTLVPDDAALFRAELDRACEDACLVLISGGLGPTTDDLTRETVADAAGVTLEFHREAWEALLARFAGRTVSDTNRKQATAPRGFGLISNPHGTAPGFHGAVGKALVIAMPGPPSELRPMFAESVVPLIRQRFGAPDAEDMLWATALMVPESSLEEALRSCRRGDITWGTRVDEDRISFSLRGGSPPERDAFLAALTEKLGPVRIRRGETRPAQLLTDALRDRGTTIATAESCTGGLVMKYLTDLSGSSRVLWGGWVTYSYEAKETELGVRRALLDAEGAVSEGCVRAMAAGALERSPAGVALAISGIAGPEGGTPEKPVGTVWIAAVLREGPSEARVFSFTGSRDMVRRRSAVAAMLCAEALLRGRPFLDTRSKW